MWRTTEERTDSARRRLALAKAWWKWEPHPRQREFFCATAQVRIAACGRRWGKTACLGVDAATLALDELAHGRACRQLIVAPSEGQARLLGEEIRQRIQSALDAQTEATDGVKMTVRRKSGLTLTLTRPSGGAAPFEAWAMCRTAGIDGAGLRGLWAHRIIVDEAARVPDAVLSDVLLPMLADVGGEYVLASSPFGRRNGFYRLWTRGMFRDPSPDVVAVTYESFQCPTRDNPNLDGSFLDAQREEMGEAAFAEEFEAEFSEDGGSVFPGDD
nr:terminase family protein [Armatimonadota bacterium]